MRLILDADAIIKLNRARVLWRVIEDLDCIVPEAVYEEVVTTGRARGHRDADEIEAHLSDGVVLATTDFAARRRGLGTGERAILYLLESEPGAWVVTDDRPFLTLLTQFGQSFFTPAQLVVNMVQLEILSVPDGLTSIERMRDAISPEAYLRALEAIRETGRYP